MADIDWSFGNFLNSLPGPMSVYGSLKNSMGSVISDMRSTGTSDFNPVDTDNSSGSINYNATGDTYRGLFSDWFNKENIAKEDFARNEQAKDNDLERNKEMLKLNQDFDERMRDTSYISMMNQMKSSGINPVLAYQSGAAFSPTSAGSYSSSGSRSGGFADTSSFASLAVGIAKMLAGLISKNPKAVVSGFTDVVTRSPTREDGYVTTHVRDYEFKK